METHTNGAITMFRCQPERSLTRQTLQVVGVDGDLATNVTFSMLSLSAVWCGPMLLVAVDSDSHTYDT
jgi:hypothetical protein